LIEVIMYPFPQSVTPAIRSHLDAQVAFLNDISKSFARSLQKLSELNIQLSQTLLEETSNVGPKLLTTDRPTDILNVTASRAQPAAEKLRSYQQHITRAVADSQVELARVAEQHVQETSRTARTLADEVARVSSEETQRTIHAQQESLRNYRDPFQSGSAHQAPGNLQSAGNGNLQSHDAQRQGLDSQNLAQAGGQQGAKAERAGKSA
jgi:phasin family protein